MLSSLWALVLDRMLCLSGWPTARSGMLGTERIFVPLASCRHLTSPSALLDTLSHGHGRSSGHATSISDAQCYASHGPGRSSHVRSGHRWLMDSGANNHMVTEESDCTSDITPLSGFITGVSVDIVGQGNCEIYVTTSSGESIPATIYGVKITPDLATRTNGAFTRIFSVRQAVRNGCSVLFSPTENSLSLPDGTNIPLDSENGLYWLPFGFPTSSDTPVAAPSPLVSKTLIHRRLYHLHDDGIRRLSAMKVPGIPHSGMFQALPFCHCCTTAKSTVQTSAGNLQGITIPQPASI